MMKFQKFRTADDIKWWLSVALPFALVGYIPAAFPGVYSLGARVAMAALTVPYAIGSTYGLMGTYGDPRQKGPWGTLYFFTHPLRGTKALIKGFTTEGSGPGAALREAAERHYGDEIEKRTEEWLDQKGQRAYTSKARQGMPDEAAQLYAREFVAGLTNGDPQQQAALAAQEKLDEWTVEHQKEEIRQHVYNAAKEQGYPEDEAKVYAEAFVEAFVEGHAQDEAGLVADSKLEEWREHQGETETTPDPEPTEELPVINTTASEISDRDAPTATTPAEPETAAEPGTPVTEPAATTTSSTSTSTSTAFGNTRATRTAPQAVPISGEDAAKERLSQVARDRYWKTQEVFQQHYGDALREIAAIADNDPAAARAIARATLRTVRVECDGVSRKQNLAQPLSRDTARMADVLLQVSTVGQQTAKLEVSDRALLLKRVAAPSVEVSIAKIQDLANYGLTGDGNPDPVGMRLQSLRLVNSATPRPERAGLNR